jgi:drug/metabolite transporter (DMT)-like permease
MLSIAGGVSLSLIAIGYKLGEQRGIAPPQIAALAMGVGALMFGIRWCSQSRNAAENLPLASLWSWAIASGLGGFACIKLIGVALRLGPVAPVSCALLLGFVPVVLYARLFHGERLSSWQYLSMTAALGAVVVAAMGRDATGGTDVALGASCLYGLVLLGMLVFNSITSMGIKAMAMSGARASTAQAPFLFIVYAVMAVASGLDLTMVQGRNFFSAIGVILGLLVAGGSIAGMICLTFAAAAPAALVFPVSSVTCIMAAALASAAFLGEQTDAAWCATIGLAAASIFLASLSLDSSGKDAQASAAGDGSVKGDA